MVVHGGLYISAFIVKVIVRQRDTREWTECTSDLRL